MVLFCIFFINSFCILFSQRHQFHLFTTASEYLCIFNSILTVLLAVNKPFCRIFKWNPYILALQCGHQLINDNRKPDGRCGFAEGFQQIVITSAVYNGFSAAKRIQAPAILSISKRAYGYDHRESQLGPYYSRHYLEMKAKALS